MSDNKSLYPGIDLQRVDNNECTYCLHIAIVIIIQSSLYMTVLLWNELLLALGFTLIGSNDRYISRYVGINVYNIFIFDVALLRDIFVSTCHR